MKKTPGFPADHSRGSALLIVLALLVLLTTLTVAFLSRATLERQLSNASFSQGKVDLAGQGAIASIIGDLQKEIVAGSNGTGTPPVGSGIYYPTSNLTAIPAIVGFTPATGLENLVKISTGTASPFYPSGTTTLAYYNISTYPAPNRGSSVSTTTPSLNNRSISNARWNYPLLMAPTGTANFAPLSNNFVAPSWIYVARDGSNPTAWNSQYQYQTNISPTTTGTTTGTNPVTQRYAYAIYDEGGTLDMNVAGSPTLVNGSTLTYSAQQPYKNALVYADLTQLLPAVGATLTAAQQAAFVNAFVGWRNFASLSLTGTTTPTNAFPTYTMTSSNLSTFDQYMLFNNSGFLGVASNTFANNILASGANMQGTSNQPDNAFISRQQLLRFVLQGLGQNTTFTSNSGLTLAQLENLMPYLGTFSRGLNQPSYQPPPLSSTTGTTTAPYTTSGTGRPAVLPAANGGNNAAGLDDAINPGFLSSKVLVQTSYTRTDGTAAVVGEPLVKKRFALSRLAWLTYLGPSSTRVVTNGATPPVPSSLSSQPADIQALVNGGIPLYYLLQGTAANIQAYFGLDWDSGNHRWLYDYHNTGGAPATGSNGAIMQLGAIAALGSNSRDPDFFELLKSAISVGSLGRSLTPSSSVQTSGGANTAAQLYPPDYYYPFEVSVDPQIIQIGANIIGQYQTAGYPVRIAYDNGSLGLGGTGHYAREYVSAENYPYLYDIQTGVIPAAQPVTTGWNATTPTVATGVTSNGIGVVTQWPVIWDPYDPNSSIGAGSPASAPTTWVCPTKFRILADQTDPDTLLNSGTVTNKLMCYATDYGSGTYNSNTSNVTLQAPFTSGYNQGTDTAGANSTYRLTSAINTGAGTNVSNSEIDLTITGNHQLMFRDPSVIMTPGTSNFGTGNSVDEELAAAPTDAVMSTVVSATSGSGLSCVVKNPTASTYPGANQNGSAAAPGHYLGFYLGAFPLVWMNKATPTPTPVLPPPGGHIGAAWISTVNSAGNVQAGVVGTYITYRMQYFDTNLGTSGGWVTYDTKYGAPMAGGIDATHGGNNLIWQELASTGTGTATVYNGYAADCVGAGYTDHGDMSTPYSCVSPDPRTHRFGMLTHCDDEGVFAPPWHNYGNTGYAQWFLYQETGGAFSLAGTSNPSWYNYETFWLDTTNNAMASFRQDAQPGLWFEGPYQPCITFTMNSGAATITGYTQASGWNIGNPSNSNDTYLHPGLLSQNCSQPIYSGARCAVDGQVLGQGGSSDYYCDPDGVLRRADGGYVPPGTSTSPAAPGYSTFGSVGSEYGTADTTMGLPMAQVSGWGSLLGTSAPSVGLYTQINNATHNSTATGTTGAMSTGYVLTAPTQPIPNQNVSRPLMLHRPFRSVAEMGYAFRDTPWKNINFAMPESGDSALLDVFTLNENNSSTALEAGKVDLNTRQSYVLAALLSNAYLDNPQTDASDIWSQPAGGFTTNATAVIGGTAALALGQGIVTRTTDTTDVAKGSGPFQNLSELVGKWNNGALSTGTITNASTAKPALGPPNSSGFIDGMLTYKGFSGTATPALGVAAASSAWTGDPSNLMSIYTGTSSPFGAYPTTTAPVHAGLPEAMAYAKRLHEAPIRALVNTTQTRVWNLMIDVIAQTGRFPATAGSLSNFNVDGERRYWVHVAIDRYTGRVLDEQVEEVKE